MSLTDEQKLTRQGFLGSSDIPAILGVDPFRTAADVYYEKTGKLTERIETAVMNRGKYLEPGLILFAEDYLGGAIQKENLEKTQGFIIDHPDGIFIADGRPIEAKTQNFGATEQWGEEGSGEVPHRVAAQCLVHLYVWDKDVCYVPADLPYRGLQMFQVEMDDEVMRNILELCQEFWEKYVKTDTPPPVMPSAAVIKRIKRVPKSVVDIQRELIDVRIDKAIKKKLADEAFEIADVKVKAALGTAELGKFDGGEVSYYQFHRKAYTVPEQNIRRINISLYKKENK